MTLGPPIKDFTDLEVWKAARDLRHEMYTLAGKLPDVGNSDSRTKFAAPPSQ